MREKQRVSLTVIEGSLAVSRAILRCQRRSGRPSVDEAAGQKTALRQDVMLPQDNVAHIRTGLFMMMCRSRLKRLIRNAGWCAAVVAFCMGPLDRFATGTGGAPRQASPKPPPEPLTNRYALVIGANGSVDGRTSPLRFAQSDATTVYETLIDPRIGRFDRANAWLLLGREANVPNLRRYFGRLRNVDKNDLVFIYFSGHGAREGGEAFWVTRDTEMQNLPGTALSNTELKLFLDRIPSERVVVALDCCYAEATVNATRSASSNLASLWKPFAGKGRIVLAGAGSAQEAVEAESLQQGVFSHFLVRGLRGEADEEGDGIVTAGKLWRYLEEHVTEQAVQADGFQEPALLAGTDTPIDQFLLTFDAERLDQNLGRVETLMAMRARGDLTAREFDEGRRLLNLTNPRGRDQQRKEVYIKLADGMTDVSTARLALIALAPDGGAEGYVEPLPPHLPTQLRNALRMDLMLIPMGTFQMGSKLTPSDLSVMFGGPPDWFQHELPRHLVRITQPFYLSAHEVTVQQFRRFVEETGYRTEAEVGGQPFEDGRTGGYTVLPGGEWGWREGATWRQPGYRQRDDHPVVMVSWNDAEAFCRWLSIKDNRPYRLPTEAEWEHACRAGSSTLFWWGDEPDPSVVLASSRDEGRWLWAELRQSQLTGNRTSPVGSTGPNPFGLFDMAGGVWEWCSDYYGRDYYSVSPIDDPAGPDGGIYRVIRGGSWHNEVRHLRSSRRNGYRPSGRHGLIGFRVVSPAH